MTKEEDRNWCEQWCQQNGWTELFYSQDHRQYYAFPPGAVIPLPVPLPFIEDEEEKFNLNEICYCYVGKQLFGKLFSDVFLYPLLRWLLFITASYVYSWSFSSLLTLYNLGDITLKVILIIAILIYFCALKMGISATLQNIDLCLEEDVSDRVISLRWCIWCIAPLVGLVPKLMMAIGIQQAFMGLSIIYFVYFLGRYLIPRLTD